VTQGFLATLRADLDSNLGPVPRSGPGRWARAAMKLLFSARVQSVVLARAAHFAGRRAAAAGVVLKWVNLVVTGADIAFEARIGPGLVLYHPVGVVIGPDCVVGARCRFNQGVTLGAGKGGSPQVGDDVVFAAGAKVFGRLTVGDRAHIGANAVVMSSVPERGFAAGIPAKTIKSVGD
jgi:serine O-acetyltransferase